MFSIPDLDLVCGPLYRWKTTGFSHTVSVVKSQLFLTSCEISGKLPGSVRLSKHYSLNIGMTWATERIQSNLCEAPSRGLDAQ